VLQWATGIFDTAKEKPEVLEQMQPCILKNLFSVPSDDNNKRASTELIQFETMSQ
jgi:hypothetical protein